MGKSTPAVLRIEILGAQTRRYGTLPLFVAEDGIGLRYGTAALGRSAPGAFDPELPVRLLQSCLTLGPTSARFLEKKGSRLLEVALGHGDHPVARAAITWRPAGCQLKRHVGDTKRPC